MKKEHKILDEIKLIFENPQKYGFFLEKSDLYPPYQFSEVKVDSAITSIAQFARKNESNYKLINGNSHYYWPYLTEWNSCDVGNRLGLSPEG